MPRTLAKEVEAAELVKQARELARKITSFLERPDAPEFQETRMGYIKHLAASKSGVRLIQTAIEEAVHVDQDWQIKNDPQIKNESQNENDPQIKNDL